MSILDTGCLGYCRQCEREHFLPAHPAQQEAELLMAALEEHNRIDLEATADHADPRFSTDYLYGPALGKMFGVMVARAPDNSPVVRRAFSGQYNGVWEVPGWVSPIFSLERFHRIHDSEERKIKELGRRIVTPGIDSEQRIQMLVLRKQKSRRLMALIHTLYRLKSVTGRQAGLQEIFPPGRGIPTGVGDCCAPKLLQHAAEHNLVPQGLAEFYWGKTNKSGSRVHGRFYSSCREKCYPILGFMLCGLDKAET